jgi:hypothetical protein
MKIHLAWIRITAAAALVTSVGVHPAAAQFSPFRFFRQEPAAQQPAAQQPAPSAATPATPYTAYQPQSPYQPAAPAGYQAPLSAYQAPATASQAPAAAYRAPAYQAPANGYQYPATAYQTPVAPAYRQPVTPYPQTAMAQYPAAYSGTLYVAQQPTEQIPPPQQPAAGEAPSAPTSAPTGEPMPGGTMPAEQAAPMTSTPAANGYPAGCNCGANGYAGANGYSPASACNDTYPDMSSYFDGPCHDSEWYGGVYFLWMGRDNPDFHRFTTQFDTPGGGYPYYPSSDMTVLSTPDVDHDFREGFEVRFGATLCGGESHQCDQCDHGYGCYGQSCDCNSCPRNKWAWEVGYWILDNDENTASVIDAIPTDTNRIYGMKNFAGLMYNGEPVNLWYDYQMPVEDPANPPPWGSGTQVRVLAQRIRSDFQAQNLEVNFLRLPLYCGGCDSGCDSHGYGGCETGDCEPACGSPITVTTLCGFRYLRIDDDFQYATMWAIDNAGVLTPPAYTPWDGVGELYYDVNVDNHLAGFQLGANVNYCVSCRCNLFWNSSFGLYNNRIEAEQRVFGDLGSATWASTGTNATIRAHKDDVAFIGELLLGGAYNFTCNCRAVVAYRAVAVSGVALSVNQIPEDFSNRAEVALVDSNGSIIIHGVQVGTEFRY